MSNESHIKLRTNNSFVFGPLTRRFVSALTAAQFQRYVIPGICMKILFILSLIAFSNGAFASEVNNLINEGVKLHDEGKYEKAEKKYKSALKLDPDNSRALYELTYTYMVSKRNKECVETAKIGLKIKSNLRKKFTTTIGNCYSQQGKIEDALKYFKEGLKIDPTDPHLHLNIAVTLSNIRQDKKAVTHLKEAIKYSNGYASPYYFIAEIYRDTNYRIPAIYFYMQFILLEPNTKRSQDASKKIYYLLYQGLEQKENGGMNIVVNPNSPKDEGDFSTLELALSLSAAASTTENSKILKNDVERHTEALVSFIQITNEINDKNLDSTFTWQYAAKNIFSLLASGDINTFSYILAEKAGIQGATDWLNKNQSKIEKMSNAIKVL